MNIRMIGLILAAIFGLTACGGGGSSAASGATSIVGTWGNAATKAETDTFNSDNTFAISQSGCTYTGGTYSVSGNKLSVVTVPTGAVSSGTSPAGSCSASNATSLATYNFTYTITGNTLTYVDSNGTTLLYALTGKWSATAGTLTSSFTFNADGSYVFAQANGTGSCSFTGGKYSVSGETLTFTSSPTAETHTGAVTCTIPALANVNYTISITSATSLTATRASVSTIYTRN
jgi:hypothetical protein